MNIEKLITSFEEIANDCDDIRIEIDKAKAIARNLIDMELQIKSIITRMDNILSTLHNEAEKQTNMFDKGAA